MDCQGLVAHLIQEAVILTSAVKLGKGWRELAEKLVHLTKQQMKAYEIPHQGKTGSVAVEVRLCLMYHTIVNCCRTSKMCDEAWTICTGNVRDPLTEITTEVTEQAATDFVG